MTFVIPQFETLFNSFNADLPPLTLFVIHLSDAFKAWWIMILFFLSATIFGCIYAQRHSKTFITLTHRLILVLPIFGNIIQKATIARFTRTLSISYGAGLSLTDALKSVASVTGNSLYTQAAYQICSEIGHGYSMQRAMQNTGLFPDMVIQLISIGEESGSLDYMLEKIAIFYEEDVDNAVDALSSLLEPVIMTILGLLIGGLVIAMYLPILKLGSII